ncbi:hypothetical protein [Natrarchaeobius chitinivorans]|nr:hypothetical protein [Natrarchaeobius chitinivorans]
MQLALNAAADMAEVVAGLSDAETDQVQPMADAFLTDLADEHDSVRVGQVRTEFSNVIEKEERRQTLDAGDPDVFPALIEYRLEEVVKTVTTDQSSDEEATYTLKFDDGLELTVARGVLFDQQKLWERYTTATGKYPEMADPGQAWPEWVGQLIEPLEIENPETGQRTAAVNALWNTVKTATAYADAGDAVDFGGVWVDDEPPEYDEIWVMREDVAAITNRHEIEDRPLQLEIAARGGDSDGLPGDQVSRQHTVNGQMQTVWRLDAEFWPEPDEYIEEPEDAIDRVERDLDAADHDDEDDDDPIGRMGEYGGDPDEDDGENGGDGQ